MAGYSALNTSLLLMTTAAPARVIAVSSSWGSPAVNPMMAVNGLFIYQCCGWYAIQYGKVNIHDHRGRLEFRRKQHRFLSIDGFPDDFEVVIRFDHLAQELSNVGRVIDEEDLDGIRMRRLVGHVVAPTGV
jgi:hypothetical protein